MLRFETVDDVTQFAAVMSERLQDVGRASARKEKQVARAVFKAFLSLLLYARVDRCHEELWSIIEGYVHLLYASHEKPPALVAKVRLHITRTELERAEEALSRKMR